MKRERDHREAPAEPAGGLDALLDTERELNELLLQADARAARIVQVTETRIQELQLAQETGLTKDLLSVDELERAATEAAVAKAADDAHRLVDRLDQVPEELVARLADEVLRDFFAVASMGEGGGSGP